MARNAPMLPDDRAAQVRAVIARMEEGESENKACETVGIHRNTFRSAALKVLSADDYAKALASLAEGQLEQIEEAIRDMRQGTIDAPMARVEIDTRKWMAAKFLPKKYGEKITQEVTGKDGSPLLEKESPEALKARMALILQKFPNLGRE